jgi:hypothetical protein
MAVRFPALDLDLTKAARSMGDWAGNGSRALCLPANVRQTHGNTADGDARRVLDDLVFPESTKAFEKDKYPGARAQKQRAGRI